MGIFDYVKGSGNFSQESIVFQNDDFGPKLEAILTNLYNMVMSTQDKKSIPFNSLPQRKELELLIFNRLGIKTLINLDYPTVGAIVIFPVTKNNILMHKEMHGHDILSYYDQDINSIVGKRGSVDLRLAKVSGIFSQYKHPLFMDIWNDYRTYNLTPAELTAVMLHELGHAFTYYEYSDRLESGNQVLSNIARTYVGSGDKQKRNYHVKELGMKFNLNGKTIEELLDTDSRLIFGQKLFKVYFKEVLSQYFDNKYDETSSEQLADNFSTRFGYGDHLVTGLSKIYRNHGLDNNVVYGLALFLGTILPAINIMMLIASISLSSGLPVVGLAITGVFSYMYGDRFKDMTYDDNKERFQRVRDQYIAMISSTELSASEMKEAIASIKAIDDIIKNTRNYANVYNQLGNILFSTHRSAKETVELQQFLESLAHNDLYLKSAEFRTMHV